MTGHINKFDEDKNKNENKNKNTITISLKIKDKKLLKSYNKVLKKNWEFNEYKFWWWW